MNSMLVNATTGQVLPGNLTISPQYAIQSMAASDSSLFLSVNSLSSPSTSTLELQLQTGEVVNVVEMDVGFTLYDVSSTGELLLGSIYLQSTLQLVNATQGEVIRRYNGSVKGVAVASASFDPVTGHILLLDDTSSSILIINPVNNTLLRSIPVLPTTQGNYLLSIAVHPRGTAVSAFLLNYQLIDPRYYLITYDLHTGTALHTSTMSFLEHFYAETIVIGEQSSDVYVVDRAAGSVVMLRDGVQRSQMRFDAHPVLYCLTGLATGNDGRIYAGTLYPNFIVELDSQGMEVWRSPGLNVTSCEPGQFAQRMSVSLQGDLLISVCNQSLALYSGNATHPLIATIPIDIVPYDVAFTSTGRTAWVSNLLSDTERLCHIDLYTHKILQTIPFGLCTVAVDSRDDTLWLLEDSLLSHLHSNVTTLLTVTLPGMSADGLALDLAHGQVVVTMQSPGGIVWLDMDSGNQTSWHALDDPMAVAVTRDGGLLHAEGRIAPVQERRRRGRSAADRGEGWSAAWKKTTQIEDRS